MLLSFFYHAVSNENLPHCKHLFPVKTIEGFEADLEFLLKNYKPFDPKDLLIRAQLKKEHFLLTFDDGLKEVGEIIAPILLKKGIPAIFFINKDFALGKSVFYKNQISFLKDKLIEKKRLEPLLESRLDSINFNSRNEIIKIAQEKNIELDLLTFKNLYLSNNDVHELAEQGFLIGGHSINHPHFADIKQDEQLEQVSESSEWITTNFHPSVSTFAFPFEDYFLGKTFFEKMNALPHAPQITFGTSEGKKDVIPYSIQRIDAEKNGWPIERIIKNYHRKKMVRQLFGMDKIKR